MLYTQSRLKGVLAQRVPLHVPTRRLVCQARSGGRDLPFNENAAQVKRLISRDRKEFLGNQVDILDKYEDEFGAETSSSDSSAPSATMVPASPNPAPALSPSEPALSTSQAASAGPKAGVAPAAASPFGGASASPFGSSGKSARRGTMEPAGLSPMLGPDPVTKSASPSSSWISRITLTQVVLVLSFSTVIGLMLATFTVVVKTGAVRLAGLE